MTLKKLIDSIKFDYVNSDINDTNFKYEKSTAKVELYNAGKSITSEEAIKEMADKGLRPATLTELLQWAEENPKEAFNENYYIVALGSIWMDRGGDRFVPCLGIWGGKRGLGLDWFELRWDDDCRFAAVSISDPKTLGSSLILEHLDGIEFRIKEIRRLLERK